MEFMSKYLSYLRSKIGDSEEHSSSRPITSERPLCVGIVGAGISGLYSALLLQHYIPDVKVKLFEANDRVGGRILTYKFSDEPYQYCEAGAMRIPTPNSAEVPSPVIQLVEYLSKSSPDCCLKLIDYVNSCPSGNRVFVNGTTMKDGRVMNVEYANTHCSELGFSPHANIEDGDTTNKMLTKALQPLVSKMKDDFINVVKKYERVSLHQYLREEAGWSEDLIVYYEVMSGKVNGTQNGVIYILPFFFLFSNIDGWKTIDGGMSKLPEACAKVIEHQGGEIVLNTKVESMDYVRDGHDFIKLGYCNKSSIRDNFEVFDAVILATPAPCIRNMKKPNWSVNMEYALRSLEHRPLIKILLRFKTRFWESKGLMHGPSLGGTSRTDLPSCRILYPSHGIGDSGKGILSIYLFNEEAMNMVSVTGTVAKIQLVLRNLQSLYPEVNIEEEYAGGTDCTSKEFLKESFVMDWGSQWCMGSMRVSTGQFSNLYPILAPNRGNVYFAGDHLSTVPLFISGALESSRFSVQQLVNKQLGHHTVINYLQS